LEVKHNTYFISAQSGRGCLHDETFTVGKRLGGLQSPFLHCGKETILTPAGIVLWRSSM